VDVTIGPNRQNRSRHARLSRYALVAHTPLLSTHGTLVRGLYVRERCAQLLDVDRLATKRRRRSLESLRLVCVVQLPSFSGSVRHWPANRSSSALRRRAVAPSSGYDMLDARGIVLVTCSWRRCRGGWSGVGGVEHLDRRRPALVNGCLHVGGRSPSAACASLHLRPPERSRRVAVIPNLHSRDNLTTSVRPLVSAGNIPDLRFPTDDCFCAREYVDSGRCSI
jgi:hypothetical protein